MSELKNFEFIICCGMYRSASTWQYMVVSEIIERSRVGKRIGFLSWNEFNEYFNDSHSEIRKFNSDRGIFVFKTHDYHTGFRDLILNGVARAVYSYRDIRDVVCSLMWKLKFTFDEVLISEALKNAINSYYKWTSISGLLVQEYDYIISKPVQSVEEIVEYLRLPIGKNEIKEIVDSNDMSSNIKLIEELRDRLISGGIELEKKENALIFDDKSLLHWNHIRPVYNHSWKNALNSEELKKLRPVVSKYLIDSGYEQDDSWVLSFDLSKMEGEKTLNQFVSYAQNFEDVILWRAFKHVQNGFYVDVGASDPIQDSITQAFYEHGWRGINIEPMQEYYQKLCSTRLGDINIPCAIGATEGEAVFFEIPESGLSTLDSEIAQQHQSKGLTINIKKIQVKTLNRIFDEYDNINQIHFLKIDVEGFERSVLESIDLSRWRPWIILVEATLPSSNISSHEAWENLIISSDYTFIYFDGLNRFYIANEHPELIASFSSPPNIFDNFISIQHYNALKELEAQKIDNFEKNRVLASRNKELEELRMELDWSRSELVHLREEIIWLRSEIGKLRDDNTHLHDQNEEINEEFSKLIAERALLVEKFNTLQAQYSDQNIVISNLQSNYESAISETAIFKREYQNIYSSFSYRITAPLRSIYLLVNKLFKLKKYGEFSIDETDGQINEIPKILLSPAEEHFINIINKEMEKYAKQEQNRRVKDEISN